MARCKELSMSKISVDKLNKQVETEFTVSHDLPDCRRINASKRVSGGGTFNRYIRPNNQFECMRTGCVNSGTLYNEGANTVYKAPFDATEFATGVITFYETGVADGTARVKVSSSVDFTDADVYDIPLANMTTGADGYKAVVVDLAKTPTSVEGNGWEAIANGAFIAIEIIPTDAQADKSVIGISSISIFDDIADFEVNSTVKIACLTTLGGAWELEALEATCINNGGYDDTTINNFEHTLTGKLLTPNYQILNPLMGKGSAVEGWDSETIEKTVEADGSGNYGVVTLPDKDADECGFMSVALADSCNITDAALAELSIPSLTEVDEKHYVVVPNEDGSTAVYFNKAHIGAPVIINYPRKAEIEEWELHEKNVAGKRVRWTYAKTWSDGTKWRFIYDNVLITSFPEEINEEESEFEFTIVIQKDASGRVGRVQRILD